MAKVIFDGRCFQYGFNGISKNALSLANRMIELGNDVTVLHQNPPFDGYKFAPGIQHCVEPIAILRRLPATLWVCFFSLRLIRLKSSQIFFIGQTFMPFFNPFKNIIVFNDLNHMFVPSTMSIGQLFWHYLLFKRSVRKCDVLVSISYGTSLRLYEKFERNADIVINPECGFGKSTWTDSKFINYASQRYILFVGGEDKRKSLIGLLNTYRISIRPQTPKLKLIVVGNISCKLKMDFKEVSFVGSVGEGALEQLYKGCLAVIVPSTYEGYGMPAMEGSFFGKPVLINDVMELKEAAGANGFIINLDDLDGQKLEKILSSANTEKLVTSNFVKSTKELNALIND